MREIPAGRTTNTIRTYFQKINIPEETLLGIGSDHGAGDDGVVDYLVRTQVVSEEELLQGMGCHLGIPFLAEISPDNISAEFTEKLPNQYLKKYRMIPLVKAGGLTIVMNDPFHEAMANEVCRLLGFRFYQTAFATREAIVTAIKTAYDLNRGTAQEFLEEINGEYTDQILSEIEETADLLDETSDAPMIKMVNLLLSGAVKDRASDIHVEPYQTSVKVRYRIDGILYNILDLPRRIQSPLVSRIKIMARLDIAEKRLPQDGRIEIRLGDKSVDIRVSVLPTVFGERVVLRLLDKSASMLKLSDLGMDGKTIDLFNRLIKSPYGIVLVTGPTGSGKTTTLYAALSSINSHEINIITIEDPIEYQIEGIGQIQVNPKIDLTFAQGLRSIVRQDPDVILVGEIRDRETADIAIQSSLTGHLVFSTLHTNDAAGAVTRLIEMGIEPFLVISSVIAVVAQRLVRVLCPACKEAYVPDEEALSKVGLSREMLGCRTLYRKKGCIQCLHTGYRGRTAIFEIMNMEESIKRLILKTSDANQIYEEALKHGMTTLFADGVRKVSEGVTTIEEVLRVTRILKREADEDVS